MMMINPTCFDSFNQTPGFKVFKPNETGIYAYNLYTPKFLKIKEDDPIRGMGTGAILYISAQLLQKASGFFSKALMRGNPLYSKEDIQKVIDEMLPKNDEKLRDIKTFFVNNANKQSLIEKYGNAQMFDAVERGHNAVYMNHLKSAFAPEKIPELMVHEAGHAIQDMKGKAWKLMQNSRKHMGKVPAVLLLASYALPNRKDGKQDFIQKNAGLLGFAAFLPTIVEEAGASLRGLNGVKKVLGNNSKLTGKFGCAWLTYVISGICLGIAAKQTMLVERY